MPRLRATGRWRALREMGVTRARAWGVATALASVLVLVGCGAVSEPVGEPTTPGPSRQAGAPRAGGSPSGASSPTSAPVETRRAQAVSSSTSIAFVNVGQGDAILIKSGSADVLIDGGPEGSDAAVGAAMRKLGMREIDTVVVSHSHADHIDATDELCIDYDPERVLLAGKCEVGLKQAARATGAKLVQARRGDTYRWGAVRAKVLSPGSISGDANADSLVLLLEVAGRRLLLTGDLTGANEATVGGICARGPPLYLLKVAHHGSRHSTGSGFLADTDPKFAVITVGANSYGHPTAETVSRLRSSGARVYTTKRNGTVTLTISRSGSAKWGFSKASKPLTKVTATRSGGSGSSATRSASAAGSRAGRKHLLLDPCIPGWKDYSVAVRSASRRLTHGRKGDSNICVVQHVCARVSHAAVDQDDRLVFIQGQSRLCLLGRKGRLQLVCTGDTAVTTGGQHDHERNGDRYDHSQQECWYGAQTASTMDGHGLPSA